MSGKTLILILAVLATLILAPSPAAADGKTKAAQEVAEFVLRKFGKEAAKDGAQALARRIERAALAHGEEVFQAVRQVGPRGLHLIEEAGAHSPQVARVLARHGEHGVVYVLRHPKALQLVLRHGEQAANVLVKSRGVALPAVESLGQPALRAFEALGTAQNARRLAMMAAEGGELAQISRTAELLAVIEKGGDAAMSFIWRHKGALAVSATLAAFLAEPEAFINGAKDITHIATENVVKPVVRPLAEVPNTIAKESAAEVARHTNWTLVFVSGIAALTLLLAAFGRRLTRLLPATAARAPAPTVPPRPEKP
jgi:hypothetical protein